MNIKVLLLILAVVGVGAIAAVLVRQNHSSNDTPKHTVTRHSAASHHRAVFKALIA